VHAKETMSKINSPDPQIAVAANAVPQVGYYNPTGGLPPRAAATLAKHARPRGDVGDWPLDDARVIQFDRALKLRKKITSAASLYRLLLLLGAIGAVFVLFGALAAMSSGRSASTAAGLGMLVALGVVIALTVLYYFAWKSTVRSQIWAPITMGVIFIASGLLNILSIAISASSNARDTSATMVTGGVMVLLTFAFAYVSFQASGAIPRYLQQPAWCQELLSKTDK
jgi:hypothetical protein